MRLTYFALRAIKHKISKARFKRRATAVPNSIDRIKIDFSTAVARRLKAFVLLPCSTASLAVHFKSERSVLVLKTGPLR